MNESRDYFTRCSTCRTAIAFGNDYYRCSVSTCNKKRAPLFFCSVSCFEAHSAEARHRDAWAEQERAPNREQHQSAAAAEPKGEHKERRAEPRFSEVSGRDKHDVLVVATRLKSYVRERAGMSTSDRVVGVLSDHLRELARKGVESAALDGRKTLMPRDIEPHLKRPPTGVGPDQEDAATGDTLVVVTKLKKYVKQTSGMSTSDGVMPVLSRQLRYVARRAIQRAGSDDRKTLLDRDVLRALKDW